MPRSLFYVQRDIAIRQSRDHRKLKGAIVGRKLNLEPAKDVNSRLRAESHVQAVYKPAGQLALVYLMRDELSEFRGKTFFNTKQVAFAINEAPTTVQQPAVVSRDELDLVRRPFAVNSEEGSTFWLTSHAHRAVSTEGKGKTIKMHQEELGIANSLFMEDNDITGRPILWLGALTARSLGDAQNALEPLEDIFPTQLQADPVRLIPNKR